MCHNAIEPDVIKSSRAIKKVAEFGMWHTESSHSSVDLEVKICDRARDPRCPAEPIKDIQSKDDRRQAMGYDRCFLTLPETAETKNGSRDAGVSKRQSLLGQRDAEPLHASFFKRSRALNGAVAISVGFDGSHDCDASAYSRFRSAKVVNQVVEIDFSPGWPLYRE